MDREYYDHSDDGYNSQPDSQPEAQQTEEADTVQEQPIEETAKEPEQPVEETTREPEQTVERSAKEQPPQYFYQVQPDNKKPTKKKGNGGKFVLCVCLAIVFGVVSCFAWNVTSAAIHSVTGGKSEKPSGTGDKLDATTVVSQNSSSVESDVADIAENVMPSVVSIQNISVQQVQNWFYGTQEYEQMSSGTGIIIGQNDTELLIVTNNHVVSDSKTLTVTFQDESSAEAQIKGADSKYDVAIVSVPLEDLKAETKDQIKIATLGDSDALRVGERTIAIGNALGYGQSVTCGIVSALNREIDDYDAKFIQTDAAINPGNSGGALLNAKGEVIGINTAKVSDSSVEGIGYAIPISDINDMLDTMMNRETRKKVDEAKRGYLGISGRSVDSSLAEVYNIPEGVFITEVTKGGAADEAGISKSSVITKFEGISVETIEALKAELEYYAIGEKVTVTVSVPQPNGEYEESDVQVVLQKLAE